MLPMLKARYRAKAKTWKLGEAGTGTVQLGIEFEIVDGDHKAERLKYFGAITDAAADFSLQAARNCGWTGTDIFDEPLEGLDANEVELVVEPEDEKNADGSVKHDDQGVVQQRLKVRWVNAGGGITMKGVSDEKRNVLRAKMKAKLAAIDAKAKRNGSAAASPAPQPPAGQVAQDDIPF